jgi:hypothetical protein
MMMRPSEVFSSSASNGCASLSIVAGANLPSGAPGEPCFRGLRGGRHGHDKQHVQQQPQAKYN